MTKDYFESEDLMQETFLSVYRHIGNIDEKSIKAYLATTAMNKSRDYLRKNKRYTTVPLEEAGDVSTQDNAAELAINDEIMMKLKIIISSLKEPYREIAKAYYLDGIPLTVYAKHKNIKPKTAQTRLRRAREKIKVLFRKEYGDG